MPCDCRMEEAYNLQIPSNDLCDGHIGFILVVNRNNMPKVYMPIYNNTNLHFIMSYDLTVF